MKISIVTISYNQCKFLKRCIDSVLSQKIDLTRLGVELEYIVVDPGSTDGSRELIAAYGNQIIPVFEKDKGPADGLNKGFSLATGNIYCYINSDDYFILGSFKKIISAFECSKVDIIYGHGYVVDESGKKLHGCFSHQFSLGQYSRGNCVLMQQATFFTSKIYNKSRCFNVNNNVSWDGELIADFGLLGAKFKRINERLACFRVYSETISGSGKFVEQARVEHERISLKIKQSIPIVHNKFYHKIIYRLSDPSLLFIRILDQLIYGKRRIPKA